MAGCVEAPVLVERVLGVKVGVGFLEIIFCGFPEFLMWGGTPTAASRGFSKSRGKWSELPDSGVAV